jgi:hypothetical protein
VEQNGSNANVKSSSHAASQKSLKPVPSSSKVKSQLNASLSAADKLKSQKKMSKKSVGKDSPEKIEDEDDSVSDSEDEEEVEVLNVSPMNVRKTSTVRFTENAAKQPEGNGESKEKQDQPAPNNQVFTFSEPPVDTTSTSSAVVSKPPVNPSAATRESSSHKPSASSSDNTQISPYTLMKRPSSLPKGNFLRHALLLAPITGKYVVKPHPTRGFRLWIIKRSVSSSSLFLPV